VPLDTNQSCTRCHAGANPEQASNSYSGTMMEQAGRDPIFLASLEIAYNDNAAAAELCVRCHYPRGWLQGRGRGAPEDNYGLIDQDYDGVECDFCHRMATPDPIVDYQGSVPPAPLSGILQENSQVFLRNSSDKVGPFESDSTIGHSSDFSPLMKDSALCAQCHDVSNTFLERENLDRTPSGSVMPFERTYSEWRDSNFSDPNSPDFASCQDCHMKKYQGTPATIGNGQERELASHRLVGANTIAPLMTAYLNPQLDLDAAAIATANEARLLLSEESALLDAISLEQTPEGPALKVRVENITGHKLPTGYAEGRRMFLSHSVQFADGSEGIRKGEIDPSTGSFTPGEEATKIYEILLGGGEKETHNFHLIRVNKVLKDNRIPPRGFRPNNETAPVAANYDELSPGVLAHYNDTLLPLGDVRCWPALVTVRLNFQEVTGEYYRFLRDNAPLYGPTLQEAWENSGAGTPTLMKELSVAVYEDGRLGPISEAGECEFSTPEAPVGIVEIPVPQAPPTEEACSHLFVRSKPMPLAAFALVILLLANRRRRP